MHTDSLCASVQHNCNIADAKHAANYTLCTYLMKMREYFRWEKGYSYSTQLPKEELGEWVAEREDLWEQLEQASYSPLEIDGRSFDPFDTETINTALLDKGMVYSGGLGPRLIPHFFLGNLDTAQQVDNYQVIISLDECARDLGAPPAMTLGSTIFIRKESIRRMLWEKVQEWQWNKLENAMAKVISYYDFEDNLEAALNCMTDSELEATVLHEIGEFKSTQVLGQDWKTLISDCSSSRVEIMLRAAKDLFADTISTLPALVKNNNIASIHFYAANMSAMRKELCPSFMTSYKRWDNSLNPAILDQWIQENASHWQQVLEEALHIYQRTNSMTEVERHIEASHL